MFKDLYKKANDSITDEALKNKILNPQPVERKRRSFVPAYSYGSLCAAAIALFILLSGKGDTTPQVINTDIPVPKYESHGEAFTSGKKETTPEVIIPKDAPTVAENTEATEIAVAESDIAVAYEGIAPMDMPMGRAVIQGRADDILYNTASENTSYALSPFSLENAISVALNGADEQTSADILSAFNMTDTTSQNKRMYSLLSQYNNSEKIKIYTANSVWINRDKTPARFNPEFEATALNFYSAESHTVTDASAQSTVNNWVYENTQGKINGVLTDSNFDGLIVNTVYFKGNFRNKFKKELTKEGTFTSGGVESTKEFMEQTSYLEYGVNGDVQVVKLPYESDGVQISMYVLMGSDRVTNPVSYVENTSLNNTYVNLKMPKFKFEYKTSLKPHLENMGISSINLDKMTDVPLSAFDVIQKTYINTDEEGTEAAAVTAMIMMTSAYVEKPEPLVVDINKDFTFVIYDETNNIALFVGEVK